MINDLQDEIESLKSKLETKTAENSSISLELIRTKQREEYLSRMLDEQKQKVAEMLKKGSASPKKNNTTMS